MQLPPAAPDDDADEGFDTQVESTHVQFAQRAPPLPHTPLFTPAWHAPWSSQHPGQDVVQAPADPPLLLSDGHCKPLPTHP